MMKIIAIIFILSLQLLVFVRAAAQDDWYFIDESAQRLPYIISAANDMAAGDVNDDYSIDALIACDPPLFPQGPGYEQLLMNDGSGTFSLADSGNFPQSDDMTECVLLFDCDDDDDLDAYVVNYNYQTDYIATNDGRGIFAVDWTSIPPDSNVGIMANYGDIDSDGDIDLCMLGNASLGADQHRVWVNDGSGHFADEHWRLPQLNSIYSSVEFADVDSDLDIDLLVNDRGDIRQPLLLINEGTGVFSDESSDRLPPGQWCSCAEFADIDGDGDFDIVLGYRGRCGFFINDGRGFFADETMIRGPEFSMTPLHAPTDIRAADLNDDGNEDLVIGIASNTNQAYIFENLGGGFYQDDTANRFPMHGAATQSLIPADYDDDGDLDIFMVGGGNCRNSIYINSLNVADSMPPGITNESRIPQYEGEDGPYAAKLIAKDGVSIEYELSASVWYSMDGLVFIDNTMRYSGGYIFFSTIPAVDSGTLVRYYYTISDKDGNEARVPPNAPDSVYSFRYMPVYDEIGGEDGQLPEEPSVRAYPNPFNQTVNIIVGNVKGGDLLIDIFDLNGNLVRELQGYITEEANEAKINWDGAGASGKSVSSGVYFARVSAPQNSNTIKLIYLK